MSIAKPIAFTFEKVMGFAMLTLRAHSTVRYGEYEMANCRAIADYERIYETPIIGNAGDLVKTVPRDDDEPGWIWCEHSISGLAGWVPEVFLDRSDEQAAVLRRDYSAMELNIFTGQTFETFETIAGWTWCMSASGDAGWVPTDKLAIL